MFALSSGRVARLRRSLVSSFSSVSRALQQAASLLPHQAILENFVHHNPLESFQHLPFEEALDLVRRKTELFMAPGERMYHAVNVDPRKRVKEAVVDLSASFLDRGAAKWIPTYRARGFLYFFATHEALGFAPWRSHARLIAGRLLADFEAGKNAESLAEAIVEENLRFMGVPEDQWEDTVVAMLLEIRGWAGMFRRMETHASEAPFGVKPTLLQYCAVHSILTRSSLMAMARNKPVSELIRKIAPLREDHADDDADMRHPSSLAYGNTISLQQCKRLEEEVLHAMLTAMGSKPSPPETVSQHQGAAEFQVYTCIDDRSGSLRRHLERIGAERVETFGVAGFFGVPVQYQPLDGREHMILAPEGQHPTAILSEKEFLAEHDLNTLLMQRKRLLGRFSLWWERASFSPIGSLALAIFGAPVTVTRLMAMGFWPTFFHRMRERFLGRFLPDPHTDFELPFSPSHAASLLAATFGAIGTQKRFSRVVVFLGHGARSVNNPFHNAYNCGACGGRDGGPNARLLARLANNGAVREALSQNHNIHIPHDTFFVGGSHNTTTDVISFFDLDLFCAEQHAEFDQVRRLLDEACGANALERCHRFLLADNVVKPEQALKHVQERSVDFAEVRPELNHASNAAVVVGRRHLTRGRFLDRRVFLSSYDPFNDDSEGNNLERVLAPALIVCSGINLEYFFSTVNPVYSAGTKTPLNVVGNIAVLQGTAGDLRTGLPSQMTEMHAPVRALFVVDASVACVQAVLARREDLKNLVLNEWVRLVVREPQTGSYFGLKRDRSGDFELMTGHEEPECPEFVSFREHRLHGLKMARREQMIYYGSSAGMVLSALAPVALFGTDATFHGGPGFATALGGTLLALPVLAFSRRYLHGEFTFARVAWLSAALVAGFNVVATAPSLHPIIVSWSMVGFSSAFLIGVYNERVTVRNNATFAFSAYKLSDLILLAAAASAHSLDLTHLAQSPSPSVAAGLILAALLKSSQVPLTALFARSMEGPTPASALGYAGLSAHLGVVLLASTMPLWYPIDVARYALMAIGMTTAVYAGLTSKIRADRKGALANATSSTVGLIYTILALGHVELALYASLGHAAFRIVQVLRSPNIIADTKRLRADLGWVAHARVVPDFLYRLCWRLRRIDSDFHLLNVLNWLSWPISYGKAFKLGRYLQWLATAVGLVIAGAPFTPVGVYLDNVLMEMIPTRPILASTIMAAYFGVSVLTFRFLLLRVLTTRRFHVKK